jgi:hypothetical protein
VGNPIWSLDEEEAHPRWLFVAAWLRPDGGVSEGSMRWLSMHLEVPAR